MPEDEDEVEVDLSGVGAAGSIAEGKEGEAGGVSKTEGLYTLVHVLA
jgi:hypothetical protein